MLLQQFHKALPIKWHWVKWRSPCTNKRKIKKNNTEFKKKGGGVVSINYKSEAIIYFNYNHTERYRRSFITLCSPLLHFVKTSWQVRLPLWTLYCACNVQGWKQSQSCWSQYKAKPYDIDTLARGPHSKAASVVLSR